MVSFCGHFHVHKHFFVVGLDWQLAHPINNCESQRLSFQVLDFELKCKCHIPLLRKKNTFMNAHETPILRTFKLCTLQKLYNLIIIL
jgi:hypothetical protein